MDGSMKANVNVGVASVRRFAGDDSLVTIRCRRFVGVVRPSLGAMQGSAQGRAHYTEGFLRPGYFQKRRQTSNVFQGP